MSEDAIDGLYALPLDAFISERDALVTRLRKEGDRDAATRVKKLRKPSVSAWAVNQLAHREPDLVGRVVELRRSIEEAPSSEAMRSASEERRRIISDLVRKAERILSEAGHAATGDTIHAITQTLHAGDDDDDRADLLRGRLTRDLQPSGLAGFGIALGEVEYGSDTDPRLEEKQRRADDLARAAEDADREAAAAERGVAEAERALDAARSRAEAARRAADKAAERAARARREADET